MLAHQASTGVIDFKTRDVELKCLARELHALISLRTVSQPAIPTQSGLTPPDEAI